MEDVKDLKILFGRLQELIDFGYQAINKIKTPDIGENYQKTILFITAGVIHKYSAAILQLCKCGFAEAGYVLLRSILEANINFQYIMAGRSNERAIGFILDDNIDRIKWARNILDFKKRHPKHRAELLRLIETEEKLKKLIEELIKDTQALRKRYRKTEWEPRIKNRALLVDKKSKNGNLEFLYLTVYWYFSHFAHLKSRGLDNFLEKRTDGIFFKIDPSFEGTEKLAISTYINYLSFLGELCNHFGIPTKKELQGFEEIFGTLTK